MNKDFEENSLYDLDENSPIHGSFVKEILQADHEPSTFNSLNGSEIPQDKNHIVLIICSLLGVSSLFAWNVLITANNFWTYVFGDDSNFEFYLSAAFNWPQFIILLLGAYFGPKLSFSIRIIPTLAFIIFSLLAIPSICSINTENKTLIAVITLLLDFLTGVSQAILFGTVLGLGAIFPPRYTTAMMSGMGIGGVFIGVLAMICQAAFGNLSSGNGPLVQAWVYFLSAVIIIWATLISYLYMLRLPFTKFYLNRYYEESKLRKNLFQNRDAKFYFGILKKIWVEAACVFLTFFITLSLFPGILLQVPLVYTPSVWYNLIIPLEFNIFDTIGRTFPYWFLIPSKYVWPPVVSRLIFFPLFVLCVLNVVFMPDPEFWCYTFLIFFAFSNGYLGTLCMMYAPSKVTNDEQEITGIAMSFFLNFGIFLASNFAIFLNYLIGLLSTWVENLHEGN